MPTIETPCVVYVDDDETNLKVFEVNFGERFRLKCFRNGKDALAFIESNMSCLAAVVCDQRMPEMTGVEVLERARALVPDAQRMMVTAYSELKAVADAVNRGQVTRYFQKPWAREEVAQALEDAVRMCLLSAKLRDVELRMLQSERLAAIGQVSAGIAHELMNPIAVLKQNVNTLRGDLTAIERYARKALGTQPDAHVEQLLADLPSLMEDIEAETTHVMNVAVSIRSQARGADTHEDSAISDVVHFAAKMARAAVRDVARINIEGPRIQVRGGPVKLTQLFLNLIVNAAHAINDSGRPGAIDVGWVERDGQVHAFVRDNGVGIPLDVQAKIFQPLFTTKPVGVGTGLGLALCREIVRAADGDLTFESQPGAGTTFHIRLNKAPS